MSLSLMAAAIITYLAPPMGLIWPKVWGIALAAVAFLPVLFTLKRVMASGNANKILAVFLGGFLFKLVLIIVGIYLGSRAFRADLTAFTVSCLAFLFAMQVCEAIYFWGKRS